MSLVDDVIKEAQNRAASQDRTLKSISDFKPPFTPYTPSTLPQNPTAADPLSTLASLYMAALSPGGGGATGSPQYLVTPTGPGTGNGGMNVKPLVGLAIVGAVGFLVFRWWKKHHGGSV